MNIGDFQLGEMGGLHGEMLGYPHKIVFEQLAAVDPAKANDKPRPKYEAFAFVGLKKIKIGVAWEGKAKSGLSYYDVTFDRLGISQPDKIYARLVPSQYQNGIVSLMWETPEEKAAFKAQQAAKSATP